MVPGNEVHRIHEYAELADADPGSLSSVASYIRFGIPEAQGNHLAHPKRGVEEIIGVIAYIYGRITCIGIGGGPTVVIDIPSSHCSHQGHRRKATWIRRSGTCLFLQRR